MGSQMTVERQQIRIPNAYKVRALTALQQVPNPHYLPFTDPEFVHAATLAEALECFRWEAITDEATGDITELRFFGRNAGPIDLLVQVLAPYIERDSYLICSNDEGERWRWNFTGWAVRVTDEREFVPCHPRPMPS